LHWLHDGPPFLSLCMRSHLAPIALHVASVIFEIAEEDSIFKVNRVVPDLAFVDHAQDFRPHGCVIAFVTFLTTRLKPDHHSKTPHRFHAKLSTLVIQMLKPDLTRHYADVYFVLSTFKRLEYARSFRILRKWLCQERFGRPLAGVKKAMARFAKNAHDNWESRASRAVLTATGGRYA